LLYKSISIHDTVKNTTRPLYIVMKINFLKIYLPLHLLALIIFAFTPVHATDMLLFVVGYSLVFGLGVSVGLHKWISHKSIKVNAIAKPIILWLGVVACQNAPIWWAAVHRQHHVAADTDRDEHTPTKGIWHAFFGWIVMHDLTKVSYRRCVDIMRDNQIKFASKHYINIIWLSWLVFGFVSPTLLLWFLLAPAILGLYVVGIINWLGHSHIGYRNFNTKDKSTNIPYISLIAWGFNWHNNHHFSPGTFCYGKGISGKQEFDPSIIFIPFIRKTK
jgi:fatty-acid desaturase